MNRKRSLSYRLVPHQKELTSKRINTLLFCLIVFLLLVRLTPRLLGTPSAPTDWQWITCDVGQGDAHLIRTDRHAAVLLDTGEDNQALTACLAWAGVETLDTVILSHEHSDHYGSYPWVLGSLPVENVIVSPHFSTDTLSHLESKATGQILQEPTLYSARQGNSLKFPLRAQQEQATAEVLWPPANPQTVPGELGSSSWTNNTSLVMHWDIAPLHDGQKHLTVLTTGDLEAEAAHSILANDAAKLPARVLKVAHHGSKGSGTDLAIASKPQLAVVSVGRSNSYGHPHPSIMDFLEKQSIAIQRTDRHGHIAVSAYPDGLHLSTSL